MCFVKRKDDTLTTINLMLIKILQIKMLHINHPPIRENMCLEIEISCCIKIVDLILFDISDLDFRNFRSE